MRSVADWDGPSMENLHILPLDVTSDESVNGLIKSVADNEKRGVDILINNAGIGVAGCLELVHIQQAKDMFDVNVWVSSSIDDSTAQILHLLIHYYAATDVNIVCIYGCYMR